MKVMTRLRSALFSETKIQPQFYILTVQRLHHQSGGETHLILGGRAVPQIPFERWVNQIAIFVTPGGGIISSEEEMERSASVTLPVTSIDIDRKLIALPLTGHPLAKSVERIKLGQSIVIARPCIIASEKLKLAG